MKVNRVFDSYYTFCEMVDLVKKHSKVWPTRDIKLIESLKKYYIEELKLSVNGVVPRIDDMIDFIRKGIKETEYIEYKQLVELAKNPCCRTIGRHYPFIKNSYDFIKSLNIDVDNMSISEIIYFIKNELKEIPKCYCGKDCKFSANNVYREYCSQICAGNNDKTKLKRIETVINKYGTDNVSKNDDIKNLIKYKNVSQYPQIIAKIKTTCFERYGVNNYSKTDEFKDNFKANMLEKFGVDNYSKTVEFKNKISKDNLEYSYNRIKNNKEFTSKFEILFNLNEFFGTRLLKEDGILTWLKYPIKHKKCGLRFNSPFMSINKLDIYCPSCDKNVMQQELARFIQKYEIINYNDRSMIYPEELDIYIKNKKIAFEYNGLYWHCMGNTKDIDRHLNKYNKCAINNIDLFVIEDGEWKLKNNVMKAFVRRKLNIFNYILNKNIEFYINDKKKLNSYEKNFIYKYDLEHDYFDKIIFAKYKNRLVFCSKINITNNNTTILSISYINNFKFVNIEEKYINFIKNNYTNIVFSIDRRLYSKKELELLKLTFIKTTEQLKWYTQDFVEKQLIVTKQEFNYCPIENIYVDYGRWLFSL